jgi:hypothetical protein
LFATLCWLASDHRGRHTARALELGESFVDRASGYDLELTVGLPARELGLDVVPVHGVHPRLDELQIRLCGYRWLQGCAW